MDSRYIVVTAYTTVIRFKSEIDNKQALIDVLNEYKDLNFGFSTFEKYELVHNDWYQRKEKTSLLHEFPIMEKPNT